MSSKFLASLLPAAGVAALLGAAASPALAADQITPEGAAALEQQVRGWLVDMMGEAIAPARPVQMTPEGDHYRAMLPLSPLLGADIPPATATVRPLDGGKWGVDGIRYPDRATFRFTMPMQDPKTPNLPPVPTPFTYQLTIGDQDGTAVVDPALATPSTLITSFKDLRGRVEGGGQVHDTSISAYNGQSTLRPAGNGLLDFSAETTVVDYVSTVQLPNGGKVDYRLGKVRVDGGLTGMAQKQVPTLFRATSSILASLVQGAPTGPGALPSVDRGVARSMLLALDGLAAAGRLDEAVEDVSISYGPFQGTLKRAALGFGVTTPDGMVQAALPIAIEGPALSQPPLGAYTALIPSQITFRPTLSNIPAAQLSAALRAAANQDENGNMPGLQEALAGVFSKGGPVVGLEDLGIAIGSTRISGQAKVLVPTPETASATAQLTATGFDALLDTAKTAPALAQALPVLVMAKGIARTTPAGLTWDISYNQGKLLVNGTDLSAMAGRSRPTPAPRPAPARPVPAPRAQ
jgi:hypothetical protein